MFSISEVLPLNPHLTTAGLHEISSECRFRHLYDAAAVLRSQATAGVGVGTVAGERCQRLLRDAQSSVDVLYGRLQHA